jgi:outer membrane protein assembly factor BamD
VAPGAVARTLRNLPNPLGNRHVHANPASPAGRTARRGAAHAAWHLAAAAALGLLAACTETSLQVQVPARVLFYEAMTLEDQELHSEAITRLQSLANENPGSRLGTFAYLKLGELYSKQENWIEADTNYRLFLSLNSNSHLTPYVLYRLMVVNYNAGLTGLFFPSREVERDMEPNRKLLVEFKRFFLLYPNSPYLEDVRPYYRAARDLLARYELMVGDFYFRREAYYSAIGRYLYLLRNYPEYPETRMVMEKLIGAYRANQQEELASEIERIFRLRYVAPGAEDEPGEAIESLDGPGGESATTSGR